MSSPSFLFANENNHTLLQSLLEVLNAMIEHQYQRKHCYKAVPHALTPPTDNPNLVYAIVRSRKRFQALRDFTLESGQEEMERQNQQRKEGADLQRTASIDSVRSPTVSRAPTLGNVPEENSAFAIGDDDDSDMDEPQTAEPPQSPQQPHSAGGSRSASIASSVDDSVPLQLRGMSEKARGKMPVGKPAFSRQNSMTSLSSVAAPALAVNEFFTPSTTWVSTSLRSSSFTDIPSSKGGSQDFHFTPSSC